MHISLGVSMGELYISSQIWGRNQAEICKQKLEHFCGSYICCISFMAFRAVKVFSAFFDMRCRCWCLVQSYFFCSGRKRYVRYERYVKASGCNALRECEICKQL